MARDPNDPIEAAIAASEQQPASPEQHVTVNITISSTGRHVGLSLPPDLTDAELLEFVGWIGTGLRVAAAQARAAKADPASRLVIARGGLSAN